jgi:hypothetical protein
MPVLDLFLTALLFAWAGTVLVLAAQGFFDVPADLPAVRTLAAIGIPVALFLLAVSRSNSFRARLLRLDPVLLTQLQAWRILGALFVVVHVFGHLPGMFAWPAGIGDVLVGVAAPFVAWGLMIDPWLIRSARFRLFHVAGLLDFLVAVATGVAARNEIPGLVDELTSSAMGQMPLVLIPTLIVPSFIMLHIISLMQSWSK